MAGLKAILIILSASLLVYLGHSVGVRDTLYDIKLKEFKKACEAKHWPPQWRHFTGWYCSAPNSVDFYE